MTGWYRSSPNSAIMLTEITLSDDTDIEELKRTISSNATKPVGNAKCKDYFATGAEWAVEDPSVKKQDLGLHILHEYGASNLECFHEFFSLQVLADLVTKDCHKNKANIVKIYNLSLTHLKAGCFVGDATLLAEIVEKQCERFINDSEPCIELLRAMVLLMNTHTECIPSGDAFIKLCVALVKSLAYVNSPERSVQKFVSSVDMVVRFMQDKWTYASSVHHHMEILKTVYKIMSQETAQGGAEPKPWLGSVISLMPEELISSCVQGIVSDHLKGESGCISLALVRLLDWLFWPKSANLHKWAIAFMRELAANKQYALLTDVTLGRIEKLFKGLNLPITCPNIFPVIRYILLAFHSPEAFHKIVDRIPAALNYLDGKFREDFVQVVSLLLGKFPGYFQLYQPINNALKHYGTIDVSKVAEESERESWLSSVGELPSFNDCTSLQKRSMTGKVGLSNLGNTCFMNSVLQALFMTDKFRNSILTATPTPKQQLLTSLQYVFAFLQYTHRCSYAPDEFLRLSRPKWFEIGHQQDCGEFLRHLLNGLYEQEVDLSKRRLKAVRLRREGMMASRHRIPQVQESDEDYDEVTSKEALRKPSDDKGFGSCEEVAGRSPKSPRKFSGMTGSRESLGSLSSLKRWTTEEDLSNNPPNSMLRNKRKAPSETCLVDSNSGSQDSGIHSVGDCDLEKQTETEPEPTSLEPFQEEDVMELNAKDDGDVFTKEEEADVVMRETEEELKAEGGEEEEAKEEDSVVSLVHQHFGGMTRTTYKCFNCHSESIHKDWFTDVHIAIPEGSNTQSNCDKPGLEDLLSRTFHCETLQGNNQYNCELCKSLQDAERSVKVVQPPQHLVLSLMRFAYSTQTKRHSKVFTNVDIPEVVKLPVLHEDDSPCDNSEVFVPYNLYAVIVHSGFTPDSGHYYAYGRHLSTASPPWYHFNDETVCFSSFADLSQLSSKLPRDTAYVLFYRRSDCQEDGEVVEEDIRKDVRDAVTRDNLRLIQESATQKKRAQSSARGNPKREDDDEDNPPPSNCGGWGVGFDSSLRYVC